VQALGLLVTVSIVGCEVGPISHHSRLVPDDTLEVKRLKLSVTVQNVDSTGRQ
jgi:hypothetical protein